MRDDHTATDSCRPIPADRFLPTDFCRPAPRSRWRRPQNTTGHDETEPPLNADPATQLRLLDVQDLDAKLGVLTHRRAALPEAQEVAQLAARRAELADALVAAETERGDIEREQRKAEADVEQVRTRATRNRERMDAGQVGSPRELESLQHELDSLARRQAELEDIELDVMERLEDAQHRESELRTEQVAVDATLAEVTARRDAAYADIDAEAAATTLERTTVVGEIPAELLALYDDLRQRYGGVGAAELSAGRCGGCRLELNAVDLGRIRSAPPDEVLRCEECRRILVRTPRSGL